MSVKKVYLSGPITGIETKSVHIFSAAEQFLTQQGFDVINPWRLNHDHRKRWEDYMAVDILALLECDAVYMLPGWETSRGARLEYAIACARDMDIYFWTHNTIRAQA